MDLSKLKSAQTELGAMSIETQEPAIKEALEADSSAAEWNALLAEGEMVCRGWVSTGLLVPSAELETAWGCSRQALDKTAKHGELFSLNVGKKPYYPAVFMRVGTEAAKAVCSRLKGEDAVAKFVFWHKTHGGLRALTPGDAILAGQSEAVVRLAEAWSAERGLAA